MFLQLAVLVLLAGVNAQDCDSSTTDECGQKIWPFLVDTTKAPANEEELASICVTLREGNQCVRSWVDRCPNKVKKDVTDEVIESIEATVRDLCDGNLGKRVLKHGACLKANLAKNFTCNTDAIAIMEVIAISEPVSERLRRTCCAYLDLDKCFSTSVTAACDSRAARVIRNLMQSYAIFMVEKCLPFLSEPEKCDLGALRGATPLPRRSKTFLPAIVDVASVAF